MIHVFIRLHLAIKLKHSASPVTSNLHFELTISECVHTFIDFDHLCLNKCSFIKCNEKRRKPNTEHNNMVFHAFLVSYLISFAESEIEIISILLIEIDI